MPADAPPPVVVDRPALYDLRDLGQRTPIVLDNQRRLSKPIRYRIPARAHKRWPRAKVFLRFHIELDRTTRGFGYVGMVTGIGTSASAEFVPRRRRGRLVTSYNTVNVYGQRSYRTTKTRFPVAMDNFMIVPDSKPGDHELRFQLESYRGFRVRRVVISPASGVQLTAERSDATRPTAPPPPDDESASAPPPGDDPPSATPERNSSDSGRGSALLPVLLGVLVAALTAVALARVKRHSRAHGT